MAAPADRVLPSRVGRGLDAFGPRAKSLSLRPLAWSVAALAGIATLVAFGFGRLPGEMRDFEVYWTAAVRAVGAEPLYRTSDGHFQFKYLPAFAALAAPAATLSLTSAKACWFVLSSALLAALVWLALAILPSRRRSVAILAAVVIVTMGKFYGHELVLGQVNILFGALAAAGILLLRQNRDVPAVALFVAAVAVKPYAIVFLPWIAVVRGMRAGSAAIVGLAALLALPTVLYGLEGTIALHQQWWVTVTESTAPNLTNNDNVSIAGMFAKWLGVGATASILTTALTLLVLTLVGIVVLRGRDVNRREALEGTLLLAMIPLVSPQGWDYVFLVATPAVAFFANYDDLLPVPLRWVTWVAVATIGLSLFDILGRERYATFMSWSVITVCFLILIVALSTLRFRRVA